jgi:hypothetical protein
VHTQQGQARALCGMDVFSLFSNFLEGRVTGMHFAGVTTIGGTYKYGHIRWTSEANRITFTLEVAFKRNTTDNSYWRGSAPDLLPQVGMPSLSVPQPYGNRRGGRPALQC